MARPRETAIQIEEISDRDAKSQIRETYSDPEAALKFFDTYVSRKQEAFKSLHQELEKNPDLTTEFARSPVGFLSERGLLGPLDQLHLEGLPNPFLPFPWPIPRCRFVCRIECRPEIQWVCVSFFGFRICWPRFHIRCRWICRIVCF